MPSTNSSRRRSVILQYRPQESPWVHDDWRDPARRMMNLTNPTSLASSGTRKTAGLGWSCTRRRMVHHSLARSPRRSPRTRHRLALFHQPGCFMIWAWAQTSAPGYPLQFLRPFIPSLTNHHNGCSYRGLLTPLNLQYAIWLFFLMFCFSTVPFGCSMFTAFPM